MQITPTNLNPIVAVDQDHVFTTSLMVAEKFDKQHKNVLQSIELILQKCPNKEFSRLNFEPRNYRYATGKNQEREATMYEMTRDGFALLVRGFTGDKAFLWNIAFINAFNHMEQLLNKALVTEHHAMQEALFDRHSQWRETAEATQNGMATGELAQRQGKSRSSVRAMKARIRAAGIDLSPAARLAQQAA